ncbi:hypothetical protein CEXT_636101 [Caerostris extrusa]|uniref:Uncharacterized protein n=1 Tax=Caerostris extrusa TaxID=172846 RepID=A0AAV4V7M1_CAEEX|nr:hypothetical protein CEXT_636101 [Caerostris extrusa]
MDKKISLSQPSSWGLTLRLRSPRMERGSRPIEAWNDISYGAVRARAYKRLWMGDRGFLTVTGRNNRKLDRN